MIIAKRHCLIALLPIIVSGCANFGKQQPAPVFEGAGAHRTVVRNPTPEPKPIAPQPHPEEIEIKPLAAAPSIETVEIQPEPIPPEGGQLLTPEQEQELAALEKARQASETTVPGSETPSTGAVVASPTEPTAIPPAPANSGPSTVLVEPKPETPVPPPPAPPAFEPLQTFAPLSPVVGALVIAANKSGEQGNIDSATTTIERAIRIEPRNATLFYKLALLRLKQSKPRMAEDLATKSALLASGDNQLKKHSWLLIAKARDMQNNKEGAKEARAKADKF